MSFSERLEELLRVPAMVILEVVENERCLVKVAEQPNRGLDSFALFMSRVTNADWTHLF